MAEKVNGFNNGLNVKISYNFTRQDELAAEKNPEQQNKNDVKEKSQMGAKDTYDYMHFSNIDLVPVHKADKVVDVKKYVTPEQEARIAGFMQNFQADYENAVQTAMDEFGVSEKTADKIALAHINATY